MTGFKNELKYPSQLKTLVITGGMTSSSTNGLITARIKNGNQHAVKPPIIIPRVLIAFESLLPEDLRPFWSRFLIVNLRL
jgi:hypothetical protein